MGYEVIKSYSDTNTQSGDEYFDVKIRNKKYPSCYQYNILIMLAKRLIKEEQEKVNACKNRARRIISTQEPNVL